MTTLDNNTNLIEKLEKLVMELAIKNTLLEKRMEFLEKNVENLEKHKALTSSIDLYKHDNDILNEVILDNNLTRSFSFTNLHSPSDNISRPPSLNNKTINPPPVMRQYGFSIDN